MYISAKKPLPLYLEQINKRLLFGFAIMKEKLFTLLNVAK